MLTRVLVCLSLLAALGCGGDDIPAPIESKSSAFTVTGTYRGSYQCGADWWHVAQVIKLTTSPVTAAFPAGDLQHLPTDYAGSNAVTIVCWSPPVPMVDGGFSYYNTRPMNGWGDANQCAMYSHRPNRPWSTAAYVWIATGGLLLYTGNPVTWDLSVWNASVAGTHDGIGPACNGHFELLLQ